MEIRSSGGRRETWMAVGRAEVRNGSCRGWMILNDTNWPSYLKMKKSEQGRELRSSNNGTMICPGENGSFRDQVSNVLNDLPKNLREVDSIK